MDIFRVLNLTLVGSVNFGETGTAVVSTNDLYVCGVESCKICCVCIISQTVIIRRQCFKYEVTLT